MDHQGRTRTRAREVFVQPAPAKLVLTWSISRAGAVACGLARNESGPAVTLELEADAPFDGATQVSARIIDGGTRQPLALPASSGSWIEDTIAGVWHLDVDEVVKLTIRRKDDGIEPLYARTPLLARAGVGGGRYEFDGIAGRSGT